MGTYFRIHIFLAYFISGIFAKNCLQPATDSVPSCKITENFKLNPFAHTVSGSSYDCLEQWENAIFIKKDGDITLDCTFPQPIDMEYDGALPAAELNIQFYKNYTESPDTGTDILDKLDLTYGVRVRILEPITWSGQYVFHPIGDLNNTFTITVFTEEMHIPQFLPMRHLDDLEAYVDPTGKTLVIPCRALNYNANVTLYYDYGPSELGPDVLTYDPRKGFLITIDEEEGVAYGLYECLTAWHGKEDRVKVNANPPEEDPEEPNVAPPTVLEGIITYEPYSNNIIKSKCKIPEGQGELADYVFTNVKTKNPTTSRLNKKCLNSFPCENDAAGTVKQIGNHSIATNSLEIESLYPAGLLNCSDAEHYEIQEYFLGTDNNIYYDWNEAVTKQALVKVEPAQTYERFTINGRYSFTCKFPSYIGVKPVWWGIKFENGTLHEELDKSHLTKAFDLELNMVEIQCGFTLWNSTVWNKASLQITVTDFSLPIIKQKNMEMHFEMNAVNQVLLCEVEPEPRSVIQWQKDGKKIEDIPTVAYRNSLILFFESVNKTHEGTYTCVATSSSGDSKLDFQVVVGEKPEDKAILPIPVMTTPLEQPGSGNHEELIIINPIVNPNAIPPLTLHHMRDDKEIDPTSSVEPGEILILRMPEQGCAQNGGIISDNGCKVFVRVINADATGIEGPDPKFQDSRERLLLAGSYKPKSDSDPNDENTIFLFPEVIDAKPMMVQLLVPLVVGFGSILLVIIIAFVTYNYYVMPWKVRRISQVSTVQLF